MTGTAIEPDENAIALTGACLTRRSLS